MRLPVDLPEGYHTTTRRRSLMTQAPGESRAAAGPPRGRAAPGRREAARAPACKGERAAGTNPVQIALANNDERRTTMPTVSACQRPFVGCRGRSTKPQRRYIAYPPGWQRAPAFPPFRLPPDSIRRRRADQVELPWSGLKPQCRRSGLFELLAPGDSRSMADVLVQPVADGR